MQNQGYINTRINKSSSRTKQSNPATTPSIHHLSTAPLKKTASQRNGRNLTAICHLPQPRHKQTPCSPPQESRQKPSSSVRDKHCHEYSLKPAHFQDKKQGKSGPSTFSRPRHFPPKSGHSPKKTRGETFGLANKTPLPLNIRIRMKSFRRIVTDRSGSTMETHHYALFMG